MSTDQEKNLFPADMSVGEIVAKARRARRLTVKRIGHDLNIRETHLEAIEENRFGDLPGKVYISGFLRSYCEYLEIDPNPLIQRLREEGHLKPDTEYALPTPVEEGVMPSRAVILGALGLLVLLLAGFGVYYWQAGTSGQPKGEAAVSAEPLPLASDDMPMMDAADDAEPLPQFAAPEAGTPIPPPAVPEEPAPATPEPQSTAPAVTAPATAAKKATEAEAILARADGAAATPVAKTPKQPEKTPEAAPAEANIPPAPAGARIRLFANEEVWVQVRDTVSDRVYVSRVLKKGESYWIRPRVGTLLDVGNPPALDVFVDGRNLGAVGTVDRRVWGLPLVPGYLVDDYYGKGLNRQANIDTRPRQEPVRPATQQPATVSAPAVPAAPVAAPAQEPKPESVGTSAALAPAPVATPVPEAPQPATPTTEALPWAQP
jgi:cytoskeleton protein RodZ